MPRLKVYTVHPQTLLNILRDRGVDVPADALAIGPGSVGRSGLRILVTSHHFPEVPDGHRAPEAATR